MKKSAFGIDSYLSENVPKTVGISKRTEYELLYYDFIRENFVKFPTKHFIKATKMVDLVDESFMFYCLLVSSNLYTIMVIKRKVESLPDNNNLIPATYTCSIMNRKCKVIERFGDIAAQKVYNLFIQGKIR